MSGASLVGDAHFAVGCAALIAGFTAFAVRKGSPVHKGAGAIFLGSMLALTASGLWMSIAREILFTVFLSAIAFHAFVSGWAAAAVNRRVGGTITFGSAIFSGAIAAGAIYGGLRAAEAPGGVLNDLPPAAFYSLAAIALLMFFFDILFAVSKTPSGQRRLTRHAWRMGFSFFLASSIFFFGNNHVLPEMLRHPVFLSAPVAAVLIWTIYYAVRTRLSLRRPGDPAA
ncbi:hypothetical protein [Aquisalinus flavus]|uniref:DUF2306 domain-containing protein n=1 Tax=Aquisalinus flavus TaxID=1526572 RepID=A0A8J2V1S1_9PROT|nr:hypothetical protein [Aquisalinus flavus]MBD0427796.1 hypothetical protein [Aquisalinus flavus]UNE47569.1 hypothetical protein FF099_05605 [Aquisalinus flavus]GGD03892.1 hypothetical protein GCM10011342_11110 [Aquisalinus flavus]